MTTPADRPPMTCPKCGGHRILRGPAEGEADQHPPGTRHPGFFSPPRPPVSPTVRVFYSSRLYD